MDLDASHQLTSLQYHQIAASLTSNSPEKVAKTQVFALKGHIVI
jgi:hypothetical protein